MRRLGARGEVPDILRRREAAGIAALEAQISAGKYPLSFQGAIWGDNQVREALEFSHLGKCAFCEVEIRPGATPQVEHYRPKAGVRNEITGIMLQPGYYWLAYHWDNLLLACGSCNSPRHKGNRFPLRVEAARAYTMDDLPSEDPLLLNPFNEDPRIRIRFRECVAYPVANDHIGQVTIDTLGLNRTELVDARRRHVRMVRVIANAARNHRDAVDRAEATLVLEQLCSNLGPYTSCLLDELG